jgi:hypothetical protein
MSNCRPQCGLQDICPACDPQLNAHVGKSYPKEQVAQELEADAVGERWAVVMVAAVCLLALGAAWVPVVL